MNFHRTVGRNPGINRLDLCDLDRDPGIFLKNSTTAVFGNGNHSSSWVSPKIRRPADLKTEKN